MSVAALTLYLGRPKEEGAEEQLLQMVANVQNGGKDTKVVE